MIKTCHNCHGDKFVWNGYRNIACPVCGNRGEVERVEQPDLLNPKRFAVYISQIKPDHRSQK